jgi:hypothetical protein
MQSAIAALSPSFFGARVGFSGMQHAFGASPVCLVEYQSVVHSQTLPIMSERPKPFGGNASTGEVRA